MKNIVPGSPEEKTEQWAERGIDMETWGFYVSGVRYGTCRKEGERVFHSPLDVTSGEFLPERELDPEDDRYVVLGKMNVREALLHLEPCQEGIRRGDDRFTASSGEIYEKKDKGAYVQRHIKFPRDLAVKDGQIVAFTTPARELCSVLVKDGYEDETVLRQWKEMGFGLPYLVHGPETFMVPMRDGVKLAADVYLPVKRERAGQEMAVAGPEGKVPTVLVRTPYGKRVGAETYYRYVQRGYAVVIQDVRGREDSEGEWLPMHYEVEDGDDTLNWIADQKWSDGKVAMTGGSYLGYVQWAAAASENPHLTAMLSSVCAGSPFGDLPRRGGCFNSGSMSWAFMVSGQRSDASLMDRDDWDELLDIRPLEDIAPRALGHQVPFLKKWLDHPDYDDFWKMGNWKERTGTHRVPALIMSGWFDDNGMGTTEALDLYEDYTEKKVILGPWKHSGNADYDIHGFALAPNALRYDIDLVCFRWIEHYLKGVENGIEKTPVVEYYTMGSGQWKTAENWPLPDGEKVTFYLDGKAADMAVGSGSEAGHGTLSLAAPENECGDHFTYDPENPSTHIIDMSENELEVPENYTDEEKRIDMLSYSTGVLEKEFTITGDAQAVIYLSSDCEDTDLMVRITDVDENGRSMKLADGVMSVRYRNQFEHPEFMEPGKVYPVTIRTTKLSHTFQKGHQMRVTVTSSAKNFIFPNSNTRDGFNSQEIRLAHNCVHHGGQYRSAVTVMREK